MRRSSRSSLLCVVAFLHPLSPPAATNFWRPHVPFICVDPPRLDYFVRTDLSNWGHEQYTCILRYPANSSTRALLTISGSRKPPLTSSTWDSSPFSHSSNVSPSTPIVITGSSQTAPRAFYVIIVGISSIFLITCVFLDLPSSTLVVVSTPEIEYSRHSVHLDQTLSCLAHEATILPS